LFPDGWDAVTPFWVADASGVGRAISDFDFDERVARGDRCYLDPDHDL
jgi:hypothetical protein